MKVNTLGFFLFLVAFTFNYNEATSTFPEKSEATADRIFNGQQASLGQFPWYATIISNQLCGGSLISPEWVLTAAHCIGDLNKEDFTILFGNLIRNDSNAVTATVDKIIVHEKFIPEGTYCDLTHPVNDVALMHLSSPVHLTNEIKTITLTNNTPLKAGVDVTVSGFGNTERNYIKHIEDDKKSFHLNYVTVKTITLEECLKLDHFIGRRNNIQDFQGQVCTVGVGEKFTCHGDSGGPVITGSYLNATLVGMISWGPACCGNPSVFTRVAYFRDWIKEKSGV